MPALAELVLELLPALATLPSGCMELIRLAKSWALPLFAPVPRAALVLGKMDCRLASACCAPLRLPCRTSLIMARKSWWRCW